jgi:hypothetical protein
MGTSTTNLCQDAYAEGLRDRKRYPFVGSPIFKIKELQGQLELIPSNLINIGKCAAGNKHSRQNLRGCVSYDRAFYTKRIPAHMAYDLGFKVLSALPSLKHENLTQHDVDRVTAHVNSKIDWLLNLAEQASSELKSNWTQAVRDLAVGEGAMYELSQDTLALVDWVIEEVKLCKKRP